MPEKVVLGVAAATLFAGCVSYTGAIAPGDDAIDEGNKPFVAKAAAEYRQRQNFRRQVVLQEAPGIGLFLGPSYVPRSMNPQANALCANIEVRRTMVQSAKAKLREIVSGLRDLEIVGENEAPMVSVSADTQHTPTAYRITYNIANVDLQLKVNQFVTINGRHPASWAATVSVEVSMIAPDGKSVFSFAEQGMVSQSDDGSLNPNATMLEEATCNAIAKAMGNYAFTFTPPIYVTDTCQNGEFVRINAGSEYGIRPKMAVEFFRYRVREGIDGGKEVVEHRVGTGTVGFGNAPVEKKSAWIHVDNYDKNARSVFQWTSVKLLDAPAKGFMGQLGLPDFSSLSMPNLW